MGTGKVFQVGIAYTQSLISYRFDGAPRPFSASFVVTNRCNLRCVYCNFPNLKSRELNLGEIELLFSKLKKMGVVRLGLLGGEPMVRKDLPQIIELAKQLGFYVSLNSNLVLYERYKDSLSKVDYFFTSLDGTPERHLMNRGKHDYHSIILAIRDIVSRGKKLTVICVVTEPDYTSADHLLQLAADEGINIHFQPEGYDAENAGRSAPVGLVQEELKAFWTYLYQKKKEGAPIASSEGFLKFTSNWSDYRVSAMKEFGSKCAGGRGFIFIDPAGLTYPCCYTKGLVDGVDLLKDDWADKFNPNTPCNTCIAGPFLEYNLLFQNPISSVVSAAKLAL